MDFDVDWQQGAGQAADGDDIERFPINAQIECASCGQSPCDGCPERQHIMRTLWRRWLIFSLLLVADLGLAWSLRHFSLW